MGNYFKKVTFQISEFFKGLSVPRKIAVGGLGAGILFGIVALFMWAGEQTYQPLFSNMNPDDAANVIRILRDKRIPFNVDPTGRNISVPPERMLELKMEMATIGLPQSNVVGYEVFDKQTLGTTSFVQKINEKRAREGELMRTIGSIRGVKRSRVHLAIPQKSAFVEDQKRPSASVVLDLDPGTVLSEKQIFGIGNLVAKSVEGMDQTDVVIVDAAGKVLSKNSNDPLAAATATQLDFRQKVEQDMEKRVEAMLSRVVGEGKVVAKISADLDFSQVAETQTQYDADGSAVVSVQKNTQVMDAARPGPVGVAGTASNVPGQPPAPNMTKTNTNSDNSVTNYKVPEIVRRTQKPSGQVKKLSVAVVLDGKTVKTTDKDGKTLTKVEPWSAEKLQEFETVVASALGIDKKRGDILEVKNMEFTHEDFDEASRVIAETERKSYMQKMIAYAVIGLTILLFFLFVVRPFIKWVTDNTVDSVDTFLPQTIEELERLQKGAALPGLEDVVPDMPESVDPEKVEGEMIKEKIIGLVDSNPHKAALILKDWLAEALKEKTENKDGGGDGKGGKAKTG